MKNLPFSVAALSTLLWSAAFAQDEAPVTSPPAGKTIYMRTGLGYSFPLGSRLIGQNSTMSGTSSNSEGVYGTGGAGLTFNATLGRWSTAYTGWDVTATYLLGRHYEGKSTYSGGGGSYSSTSTLYGRGVMITPSITFRTGGEKFNSIMRVGAVFGKLKAFSMDESSMSGSTSTTKNEYSGGLSAGFKGSIGLDFNPGERTGFFMEMHFTSMNYFPKRHEITSMEVNGTDMLSSIPANFRTTEFKREVTYSSMSGPQAQLAESIPFGSWGINAGIRFKLSKAAGTK